MSFRQQGALSTTEKRLGLLRYPFFGRARSVIEVMRLPHALATVGVAVATAPAVPVSVAVDATDSVPFVHRWKRSFGSGHASLTLRSDWRKHLTQAVGDLGLTGVRYHGLFDDDMAVVPGPMGAYNFTLIDSTWDFLLQSGVTPIVELSFMPAFIANCTWHGHCKQDKIGCTGYWCTQCSGHGVGPVVNPHAPSKCTRLEFWYQGIKQLPFQSDYTRWYELVFATVVHAIKRYGLAEVQRWNFEVWNELWGLRWPTARCSLVPRARTRSPDAHCLTRRLMRTA